MSTCTRCGADVVTPGRRCTDCAQGRYAEGPGLWRERAACRDELPELFTPPGYGRDYADEIAHAMAVCETCPVITDCLAWALDARDTHSILGGTTPDERALILRRRQRAERRRRQAVSA